MKDALALTAAAVWFGLNIVLWAVIESTLELFGWSLGMGAIYLAGFFGYLSHRDRLPS
jgi:hypothetical protein